MSHWSVGFADHTLVLLRRLDSDPPPESAPPEPVGAGH